MSGEPHFSLLVRSATIATCTTKDENLQTAGKGSLLRRQGAQLFLNFFNFERNLFS